MCGFVCGVAANHDFEHRIELNQTKEKDFMHKRARKGFKQDKPLRTPAPTLMRRPPNRPCGHATPQSRASESLAAIQDGIAGWSLLPTPLMIGKKRRTITSTSRGTAATASNSGGGVDQRTEHRTQKLTAETEHKTPKRNQEREYEQHGVPVVVL